MKVGIGPLAAVLERLGVFLMVPFAVDILREERLTQKRDDH